IVLSRIGRHAFGRRGVGYENRLQNSVAVSEAVGDLVVIGRVGALRRSDIAARCPYQNRRLGNGRCLNEVHYHASNCSSGKVTIGLEALNWGKYVLSLR